MEAEALSFGMPPANRPPNPTGPPLDGVDAGEASALRSVPSIGLLLSSVTAFFSLAPPWIWLSSADRDGLS